MYKFLTNYSNKRVIQWLEEKMFRVADGDLLPGEFLVQKSFDYYDNEI